MYLGSLQLPRDGWEEDGLALRFHPAWDGKKAHEKNDFPGLKVNK